jgi:hypothetical protein
MIPFIHSSWPSTSQATQSTRITFLLRLVARELVGLAGSCRLLTLL